MCITWRMDQYRHWVDLDLGQRIVDTAHGNASHSMYLFIAS